MSTEPEGGLGNYKGVMLCNRPNEPGDFGMKEREGPAPFLSRVVPKEQLGLNLPKKIVAIQKKKTTEKQAIKKHRKFIAELNEKKRKEKELKQAEQEMMKERDTAIKKKSQIQRKKITLNQQVEEELKAIERVFPDQSAEKSDIPLKPAKLTEANIKKHEKEMSEHAAKEDEPILIKPVEEQVQIPKQNKPKEKKKPMWAYTEKQAEELKENEVDDLIEFAYQLDYEKYIEDFEVKQALTVLQNRVQELKKDDKWKENFAEKWNREQENREEAVAELPEKADKLETKSVKSHTSYRSKTQSIKSVADITKEVTEKEKKDWDKSVKGDKLGASIEDKIASQLAEQVLQNAPQLKGIHSKASIMKLLEREAKAQLVAKQEPKIVTIKDREAAGNSMDPSNLPYLHRNESI